MGNYCYVHPEKKKTYVTQYYQGLKPRTICTTSGYSLRAFYRLQKLYETTGQVTKRPLVPGAPRVLTSLQLDYLEGLIERTPDIYLSEMQDALWNVFEVDVDVKTISNSLRRRGFTQKKIARSALE
ncbi:hypothetical protein VNI00_017360 [Paramarasmius palmivorus]|uniref:Transposase n=1 Tax=Paramarasmius palmivorus TaxID=297713 RepID=A0AAW0B6X0_9AGAR